MAVGHGFNFIHSTFGEEAGLIASGLLAGVVAYSSGRVALAGMRSRKNPLIPEDKMSFSAFYELVAEFILRLGDNVMGKHNRKYLPFIATIFFYIFSMNLMGLIPGFSGPTSSVAFNLGMALVVLVMYTWWGVKEVGLKAYLGHMWGPIWWVGPLLFPVELISHLLRPLSLSLRLYGNMTGDHIVLAVFTDLTKLGIPVIFYFLGLFVCFMQAFVFSLLTMIYIRFAVAHEEH